MKNLARLSHEILRSDRDVNFGIAGFTGEGKSSFLSQLMKAYARVSRTRWTYEHNMTWSRKELKTWIEGKGKDHKGRKAEYTALAADELFAMLYRRNWYTSEQKEMISLFNMCRDRHLLIAGNIPVLWDLDGAFITRIRFFVYIPRRGIAWVFEQENNPFSTDPWNVRENRTLFRKYGHPYKIKNFVSEIKFPDWSPAEKAHYYRIRNEKRSIALKEIRNEGERYKDIKEQRNKAIRLLWEPPKKLTNEIIGEHLDLSPELIRLIRLKER